MSGPADKTSADVRKETKTPAELARTTTSTDSNLVLEEGSRKTWGRPSVVIAASQEEALGAPRHGSTRATSSRLTSTEHLEEEQVLIGVEDGEDTGGRKAVGPAQAEEAASRFPGSIPSRS